MWGSCLCRHYAPRLWLAFDWLLSMNVAISSPAVLCWTLFIVMRQADPGFKGPMCKKKLAASNGETVECSQVDATSHTPPARRTTVAYLCQNVDDRIQQLLIK